MGTKHDKHNSSELPTIDWRDWKRFAWLMGLIVPALPLGGVLLVRLTSLRIFWWFGAMFSFCLLPLLDALLGKDSSNPPDSVLAMLEADRYYRYCLYAFIPLQYLSLGWACFEWSRGGLSVLDSLGLVVTVGIAGAGGINAAHELGHKNDRCEHWFSKITLAQTGYGHFFVEHNRGHHLRAATPEDPASARLGESFWAFLPRTVVGSVINAWRIEADRLARRGRPVVCCRNDVLNAWGMTFMVFGGLSVVFRLEILPSLILQAIVGFCLLEVVNYLEHYGLARRKLPDGRYEPCAPQHSWNSNNLASNILLYHLQRHSDHHAHPSRCYQSLRSAAEAPELPSGYGTMIVVALITPLWYRVMDPRVITHYGGMVSLANIEPSKRHRYAIESSIRPQ